ncbi:MAG: hypothetical protein ACRDRR_03395 [Pseudonocardiaceae bacterium]
MSTSARLQAVRSGPLLAATKIFALAAMERELEATIGRAVDLRTYHDLSRYFRDDVVASARVVYAA